MTVRRTRGAPREREVLLLRAGNGWAGSGAEGLGEADAPRQWDPYDGGVCCLAAELAPTEQVWGHPVSAPRARVEGSATVLSCFGCVGRRSDLARGPAFA